MTPIEQAQQEWDANTTAYPKIHHVRPIVRNNPITFPEDFRQFDKAIALLNWNSDCIEITKLETLQPRQGGPSRLIGLLKRIADKYQLMIWGHARPYEPDPPFPVGGIITKDQLDNFYRRHGFVLREIDSYASEIKYVPNQFSSSSKA
jgi:hypothetical protein